STQATSSISDPAAAADMATPTNATRTSSPMTSASDMSLSTLQRPTTAKTVMRLPRSRDAAGSIDHAAFDAAHPDTRLFDELPRSATAVGPRTAHKGRSPSFGYRPGSSLRPV